jgi:predicted nucleotidyltransferase component of viral defense system
MFDPVYARQAELMLRCLPEVSRCDCFALKGGTAINFFVRAMPRLSVDIDLVYLPLCGRDEALAEISSNMEVIAESLGRRMPGVRTTIGRVRGVAAKLLVAMHGVQVKIEPNLVLRGSVFPAVKLELCAEAEALFKESVAVQSLGLADLYGGKLCAALDRQHPRDLFDIHLLLQNEGLTPDVRRAFVVYLASHDRPMHELLDPTFKEMEKTYVAQFAGMARDEVALPVLVQTLKDLPGLLVGGMTDDEKGFLLSMKQGEPEWAKLAVAHVRDLPALQWKLINIRKMDKRKRKIFYDKLRGALKI